MSDVDCSLVLHMAMTVGADACAGARATIRAAEIQAKATRHAGNLTLSAGALALIAAVSAARMQVTIDWAHESARRAKFYGALRKQMQSLHRDLDMMVILLTRDHVDSSIGISYVEDRIIDYKNRVEYLRSYIFQEDSPLKDKELNKYETVIEKILSSTDWIERCLRELKDPQIYLALPSEEVRVKFNTIKTANAALNSIGRIIHGRFHRVYKDPITPAQ